MIQKFPLVFVYGSKMVQSDKDGFEGAPVATNQRTNEEFFIVSTRAASRKAVCRELGR